MRFQRVIGAERLNRPPRLRVCVCVCVSERVISAVT